MVAYNPDSKVVANIGTYLDALEFLLIVDNSPHENISLKLLEQTGRVAYRWDGTNYGIATALNMGAMEAINRGYGWMLTMDQDSHFQPGALEAMAACAREHDRIGILSPIHLLESRRREATLTGCTEIKVAMTSGNLLSLEAYRAVGPFLDKLFIDYVDYEFCLRLNRFGYHNLRVNHADLVHSLGNLRKMKVLFWDFRPTHHSVLRRYYMTRNRLYVMRTYPFYAPAEAWAWAKELMKLVLFEKDRRVKLQSMVRGFRDFLIGRYGRCE